MNASRAARASQLRCAVLALIATWPAPLIAQTELPCPEAGALEIAPHNGASGVSSAAAPALVLLLELGPALSRALVTALDPWGLRVVESPATNPGPSMPSSALAAQHIARRCSARALVWLAPDANGFALWVYDAESDRSVARPVPAPPFDASAAAALALSVKTVLRLVGLAPEQATAPAPLEPLTAPAAPPAVDSDSSSSAAAAQAEHAAVWQVGAYVSLRFGPFAEGQPDPRYAALVLWSPWASPSRTTRAWLRLAFEAGSPHRVRGPRLEGQIWDSAPELAAGLTQAITPGFALGLSGAAALHVTALSGVARELDAAVGDTRFNPALRAQGELQLRLGRPVLALQPGVELWLRNQRYLVQATPALETRRGSVHLALAVQLPLD